MSAYSYYRYGDAERVYGNSNFSENITADILVDYTTAPRNTIITFQNPVLSIKPFIINKWQVAFINPEIININTSKIAPGLYRIMAIQNFQVEDCNPDLNECLAGVFLSRKLANRWEQAEDHPRECRTIDCMAMIDTKKSRVIY